MVYSSLMTLLWYELEESLGGFIGWMKSHVDCEVGSLAGCCVKHWVYLNVCPIVFATGASPERGGGPLRRG
jgi:hypothetical protein